MTDTEATRDRMASLIRKIDHAEIGVFAAAFREAMQRGARVYTFGNGGSAALAAHLATDLLHAGKRLQAKAGSAPRALSSDDAVTTAVANDEGYEEIFAFQLRQALLPEDVVVAISASGRSPNILRALDVAHRARATVLILTGAQGEQLRGISHACFVVDSTEPYVIESVHLAFTRLVARLVTGMTQSEQNLAGVERPMTNSPTTEDQRKLHLEVNQIMNQRFTLITVAIAVFAGKLWASPRTAASPEQLGALQNGLAWGYSLSFCASCASISPFVSMPEC